MYIHVVLIISLNSARSPIVTIRIDIFGPYVTIINETIEETLAMLYGKLKIKYKLK